jgi:CheY-like chemotaxis protein
MSHREGPSLRDVRVLLVDDEPDTRELLREVLERCGARVRDVGSAHEALEQLKEWRPMVIVSDIGMPGEDGYSLIRRVREWEKGVGGRTPAVALTAYARSEDRMKALAAGYQVHAAKPIDPMEFAFVVAGVVQQPAS